METPGKHTGGMASCPIDLGLLLETITEHGIVLFDTRARVIEWSAGAKAIFGFEREEIVGGDGHILFTPEDRSDGIPELEMATAEREGRALDERWHIRKNGQRFWASGLLYRVAGAEGSCLGFVKVLRDITEKRQTADALIESERKLEFYLENLRDHALFMVNREGQVASWNQGAERLFCWPAEEILGRPLGYLFGEQETAEAEAARELEEAAREGKAERERLHRRKDGSVFWGSAVTVPLIDREDELRGYARVMRDATDRKRSEEAHRMEAIGRLAGGVAHDFNNMLTAINGYAELLLAQADPGAGSREWVEEIRRAGERAAALTRQLLAFSRRQVLTPQALSLNEIVQAALPLLQRTLGEDIRLHLDLEPALHKTHVDPGRFEEALIHLALNAREAMPEGGEVAIRTRNVHLDAPVGEGRDRPSSGEHVLLSFRDSGPGIAPEIQPRIFEPFFTTKSRGTGSSGLGLSAVYGLVRQCGGIISVASEPNRGAEFRIHFPSGREASASPHSPGRSPVGNRAILLVEDEDSVRRLAAQVLRMEGYQVSEARNGDEALALLEQDSHPLDLVLTDVVMPIMGGWELSRRLQQLRPEVAVIFMSGYTEESVFPEGVPAHSTFIRKPFTVAGLLSGVRATLGAVSRA